jgi:hypothetical protein
MYTLLKKTYFLGEFNLIGFLIISKVSTDIFLSPKDIFEQLLLMMSIVSELDYKGATYLIMNFKFSKSY